VWCGNCQHDAPSVAGAGGEVRCIRCGQAVAALGGAPVVAPPHAGLARGHADPGSPPTGENWSWHAALDEIDRRLAVVQVVTASARAPQTATAIRAAWHGTGIAACVALVALAAMFCGAALVALGAIQSRPPLGALGWPMALCGAAGLAAAWPRGAGQGTRGRPHRATS
jgi:hypothetical protein